MRAIFRTVIIFCARMVFQKMGIGERLKYVRGKRTQPEMAGQVNVTKETWGRYEREVNPIPSDILMEVCRQNGISPHWLLTGQGPVYQKELPYTSIPKVENNRVSETPLWGKTKIQKVDGQEFQITVYGDENSRSEQNPPPRKDQRLSDMYKTLTRVIGRLESDDMYKGWFIVEFQRRFPELKQMLEELDYKED